MRESQGGESEDENEEDAGYHHEDEIGPERESGDIQRLCYSVCGSPATLYRIKPAPGSKRCIHIAWGKTYEAQQSQWKSVLDLVNEYKPCT